MRCWPRLRHMRRGQPMSRAHRNDSHAGATDWAALVRELGPDFAARAADHDASDTFVAENFEELRARGALAAGVPAELGGGGASHAELCRMVRVLARYCGS